MRWVKGCDFRAWVVLLEMGQTEEVGSGRRFGQNVTAGPSCENPRPPLVAPLPKPYLREADLPPGGGVPRISCPPGGACADFHVCASLGRGRKRGAHIQDNVCATPGGCCRRLSRCAAIKKSERKGRRSPVPDGTGRSFDSAIEGGRVAIVAAEKTRIPQCGTVRATRLLQTFG
jgi:hypothetical protein